MTDRFGAFANYVSQCSGRPLVFVLAVGFLLVWAVFGPITGFSQQWQLIVNTGTTILTFLMVFIIQNTQNRHTTALQIKLDEVIRAIDGAKNELIDLEDLSEAELKRLQKRFATLGEKARKTKLAPRLAERSAPARNGDRNGKAERAP